MRRKIYTMEKASALALLRRSQVVHIATTAPDGEPLFRTVHGVVVGDALIFHAAAAGEKMLAIGRRAVVSAEEFVVDIPSHFNDPERACPATTFYRSVQIKGVLERVDDLDQKAAMLQALMERYQPEGGYKPITAHDPLYEKPVRGLLLMKVSLLEVCGKLKMGQNRKPHQLATLMEKLWARGASGDPGAIEAIRRHNPKAETPAFLAGPEGVEMVCELDDDSLEEAARLLEGQYWTAGCGVEMLSRAIRGSSVRVGARDRASGRLVAFARAVTDGVRRAWVYDVIVADEWRGRGLGEAVMRLALDHPRMRAVSVTLLATRDAMGFYDKFGFEDVEVVMASRPWRPTQMALVR